MYDEKNVFAKILSGDIPCCSVYEDDLVLAFEDIEPKAPVHILVIPKGKYSSLDDFAAKGSAAEKAALLEAIGKVAAQAGISESGYRVITNIGRHGGQEVPHLHFHILGGEAIGPIRL